MCVGRCVKGRGQSGAFVCSPGPGGYVSENIFWKRK